MPTGPLEEKSSWVRPESERPLRVMMLHNHYQQPGGEDECFAAESALLESRGHRVDRFVVHNDSIDEIGLAATAGKAVWNRDVYRQLRARIRRDPPDILHAHNLFPLISPAALHAAKAEHIPVVLSVHNFRLFCANAIFFRDGRPCEVCLGRVAPWHGVLHRCYRDSMLLSSGVAAMIGMHRLLGTWRRHVDIFIALTQFARAKLVAGGLPANRITVKPNFLTSDTGPGPFERDNFALFAGRLSPEKGIGDLVHAWRGLAEPVRLLIIGDGPLAAELASLTVDDPRIKLLGRRPLEAVQAAMRQAELVVAPSAVQESFGRVAIEAFAAGTPVLASRLGGLGELVTDGVTGRLFSPDIPGDLGRRLTMMLGDPQALRAMRSAARAEFERHYTAEANYAALMQVYAAARARALGCRVRDVF